MTTPTDPLYDAQWHFPLLGNIEAIWQDYSGEGVRVVVYDDGVEYTHEDIAANYDSSGHFTYDGVTYDPFPLAGGDAHGTSCAGLIGAVADNGVGGTGVAFGVTLTGVNYLNDLQNNFGSNQPLYDACMQHAANFDIMSNSWGISPAYGRFQNLNRAGSYAEVDDANFAIISAEGRDGLGTIIVVAAGNDALNANGDGTNASRFGITVAATEADGFVADYSNFGVSVLVAAPASAVTIDRTGNAGYNRNGTADGDAFDVDYTSDFGGTSAATPTVAGVIALMLEANAGLGWRDVQSILAMSAGQTGSSFGQTGQGFEQGEWASMGGSQWNGGGSAYHLSYGYGMVDAFAAVRMAEAWTTMFGPAHTSANEQTVVSNYTGGAVFIPDLNSSSITRSVTQSIEVESVYVTVDVTHSYASDLQFTLIAPDGSVIMLFDNEGGARTFDNGLRWTFAVESLRGYDSAGDWTLQVRDTVSGDTGRINDFDLSFFGAAASNNDVHHFTDDFRLLADVEDARRTITDTNGGIDWLNFSAVAGNITASLANAGQIRVDGVFWAAFAPVAAAFENLFSGDGNDRINGNALANAVYGKRGDDILRGVNGNDTLMGGDGRDFLYGDLNNDLLRGGTGDDRLDGGGGNDEHYGDAGRDSFVFGTSFGADRVLDFADNLDTLRLDDALWGGGRTVAQVLQTFGRVAGGNVVLDFGASEVTLVGVGALNLLLNDIAFV